MKSALVIGITLCAQAAFGMYRTDLWIPQTHTLNQGEWQIAVERKAQIVKPKLGSGVDPHTSMAGASFGLYQTEWVGVEGGFEWQEPAYEDLSRAVFGHLRVRAMDVNQDGWSVALGIEKLGFVTNKNDINMVYFNMQNRIDEKWYIGAGAYTGSARYFVDDTQKKDAMGATLGVWRQIQMGRGRLALEYQSGRNFVGFAFAGMTLELSEFVYGTIGYGFSNNPNLVKDWVLTRIVADF